MTDGLFAKFADAGFMYFVIPIMPADAIISVNSKIGSGNRGKVPGKYLSNGSWSGFLGWTKLNTKQSHIDIWKDWPKAGVGIRCGAVVGVDIDVTDEKLAMAVEKAATKLLGKAPCRIGNSPKRLLPYRIAEPLKKSKADFINSDTGEVHTVEILGKGQQFVAHGIHPKTNKPYRWNRGDLTKIGFDGLTEITAEKLDNFIEEFGKIMMKAGCKIQQKKSSTKKVGARRKPIGDQTLMGDPIVVAEALETLGNTFDYDGWIKALAAVKASLGGLEEHYVIYEKWSAWYPENDREIIRSKWDSISDSEVGFSNLMGWAASAAKKKGENDKVTRFKEAVQNRKSQIMSEYITALPGVRPYTANDNAANLQIPASLMSPPGLVGAIAAYHDSISLREVPICGIVAGLTAVSAVSVGRFLVDMPRSPVSINLFMMLLADTGVGKEMVRTVVGEALNSAEYSSKAIDPASDIGLLKALASENNYEHSGLWMCDEFGRYMAAAGNPKSGGHYYALVSTAMKLFGLATSRTQKRVYADRKQFIDPIEKPYFGLLATSTPKTVTQNMTSGDVIGGFLNRFIVIPQDDQNPPFNDAPRAPMSKALKEALVNYSSVKTSLELIARADEIGPVESDLGPYSIIPNKDALAALLAFRSEAEACKVAAVGSAGLLWVRAYENAIKVAGNLAVGDSTDLPRRMTIEHAVWAVDFMRWSTKRTVGMLTVIGDNETERNSKKIQNFIIRLVEKPSGDKKYQSANAASWVSRTQIMRGNREFNTRELSDILTSLIDGGYLEQDERDPSDSGGPSTTVYRPLTFD